MPTKNSSSVIPFWEATRDNVIEALIERARAELRSAVKASIPGIAQENYDEAQKDFDTVAQVMGLDIVGFAVWYQAHRHEFELDPEPIAA